MSEKVYIPVKRDSTKRESKASQGPKGGESQLALIREEVRAQVISESERENRKRAITTRRGKVSKIEQESG